MRYVDDFICLGPKAELHALRRQIKMFLAEQLQLRVDPSKDRVLLARNGIPWLGFVLRPNKQARLRKAAVKRFTSALRRARREGLDEPSLAEKLVSWYRYVRRAAVQALLNKLGATQYLDKLLVSGTVQRKG